MEVVSDWEAESPIGPIPSLDRAKNLPYSSAIPSTASSNSRPGSSHPDDLEAGPELPAKHLSQTRFLWGVFARQLVYHLLPIFSLPLMLVVDGKYLAINEGFLPGKSMARSLVWLNLNYTMYYAILGMCITYFVQPRSEIYLVEVLTLFVFSLLRIIMICVKYAWTMGDPFWEERLTSCDMTDEMGTLLLTAWANPSPSLLAREIKVAEDRIGSSLESRYFCKVKDDEALQVLNARSGESQRSFGMGMRGLLYRQGSMGSQLSKEDEDLSGSGVSHSPSTRSVMLTSMTSTALVMKGHTANLAEFSAEKEAMYYINVLPVSGRDWAMTLLAAGNRTWSPTTRAYIFAILFALIPTFHRLGIGVVKLSPLDIVFNVFFASLTFFQMQVVLQFLCAGISDYSRRLLFLTGLEIAIIDSLRKDDLRELERAAPANESERIYRSLDLGIDYFDLTVTANVRTWTLLFEMIGRFGLEYRKRAQVYFTGIFAVCTVLVLVLVITGHNKPNFAVALIYVGVFFVFLDVLIAIMAFKASQANSKFASIRSAFSLLKIRMGHAISELPMGTCPHRRLVDARAMVTDVIEFVQIEDNEHPFKVLGVRVNGVSIRLLFTFVLSLVGFALNVLYQTSRI